MWCKHSCRARFGIAVSLLLFGALFTQISRGQSVLLADGGNSMMRIIISEAAMNSTSDYKCGYYTPTIGERQVAFELADVLTRITGQALANTHAFMLLHNLC